MLYATESLKILLQVVEPQENIQGVPSVLRTSNVCTKVLEIMGGCPEHNKKTIKHQGLHQP